MVGGGGMSSEPGTDRLRLNFMAGGARYGLSSSAAPEKIQWIQEWGGGGLPPPLYHSTTILMQQQQQQQQ